MSNLSSSPLSTATSVRPYEGYLGQQPAILDKECRVLWSCPSRMAGKCVSSLHVSLPMLLKRTFLSLKAIAHGGVQRGQSQECVSPWPGMLPVCVELSLLLPHAHGQAFFQHVPVELSLLLPHTLLPSLHRCRVCKGPGMILCSKCKGSGYTQS